MMSFTLAPFSVTLLRPTIRSRSLLSFEIPTKKSGSCVAPVQEDTHLSPFTRCCFAPHAIRKCRDISVEKEKEKQRVSPWVEMVLLGLGAWIIVGSTEAAWAFGPEGSGPLVEEFWENMRRYGLYFFTVGTGALYTILKPIYDLLKSPVSAVLVIVILSASFYLLYLVLSAMIGLSDFSYQYAS
ncbi:hypothetical protein SUGI_1047040 [Cryptomeria japonica]|nr:hypothetical protein SUGI_1047040 [Cryptomeria japonica]